MEGQQALLLSDTCSSRNARFCTFAAGVIGDAIRSQRCATTCLAAKPAAGSVTIAATTRLLHSGSGSPTDA
jgi:hypothetical protein